MLCQAFLFFSFILTVEGLARNRSFVFFSPEETFYIEVTLTKYRTLKLAL